MTNPSPSHRFPDSRLKDGARRTRTALAAGILAAGCAAVWWLADGGTKGAESGVVRIGYAVEAPYAFLTADGRVTGEAPEIARRVSEKLGRGEPEWVLTEFAELIEQLEAGRFDVIAAGMFITEERARRVAFSRPTGRVRPGLLVERGNPHRLHTYADAAARAGVRLAVLEGSVEARTLAESGLPAERLVAVPDPMSGLALLKTRRVDGLALSQPTVRWMAEQVEHRDDVEAASPFTPPQGAGEGRVAFAFRRGDGRLRRAWDDALAEFLHGHEHRQIAERFGFETDSPTTEGGR